MVALSALRVVFYRAGDLQEALRRDPRIGLCLIRIMAAKQQSLAHGLIEASSLPPRARLLDLLERLRDAHLPAGSRALELPLTHEDLAGYLGLSRVTVTRAVNALRRERAAGAGRLKAQQAAGCRPTSTEIVCSEATDDVLSVSAQDI